MIQKELSAILDKAEEHLEKSDYGLAEELARQGLRVEAPVQNAGLIPSLQSEKSPEELLSELETQALALIILGSCCANTHRFEEASRHLSQALDLAIRSGNPRMEVRALNGSAILLWRKSQNAEALELAQIALHKAEQLSDVGQQAVALGSIGTARRNLSDYAGALEYFQRAMSVNEELGNQRGVANVCNNIGLVYWPLGDCTRAFEFMQKALAIFKELGNRQGVIVTTGNIGSVYKDLSEFPRALEYLLNALMMDEEQGNLAGVARHNGNIGIVYWNLADYSRALEYYQKALIVVEQFGNRSGVAWHTANIGTVHWSLGDYMTALEYMQRALSMHTETGDRAAVATLKGNIGEVYESLGEFHRAMECYTGALSMFEELGNQGAIAGLTGNIGNVSVQLTDFEKAMTLYQKALQLHEVMGNRSMAASVKTRIGMLLANESNNGYDSTLAEEILLSVITTNEELGTKIYEVHQTLADLFERQGRTGDALQQFKLYHDLEKEVQSEEAKKKARQIEQLRQIAEREKEIAIAKAAASAELKATTSLLHKVLPESIATRMISGEEEIADYFPNVSILFADIAGFTPLSADMPAFIVVRFLNFVFREFDRIVKKHGCEKIKTIGDGYMAVAGAPLECTDHAERMASAALEMMQTISLPDDIREYVPDGTKIGVRIGLHTGSVVAGVIGEERFVYDVYSDAVNTAARMESYGEPNRIHVSSEFVRHLQSRFAMNKIIDHGMVFEKRGEMEIKGKGMMKTYFLSGRRASS